MKSEPKFRVGQLVRVEEYDRRVSPEIIRIVRRKWVKGNMRFGGAGRGGGWEYYDHRTCCFSEHELSLIDVREVL